MAKKAAPKAAEPKPEPKPEAKAPKKAAAAAPKAAEKAKPATKAEIYGTLAEKTGLSKKDIASVFEAMSETIAKDLGKKGPGIFVVPGLLKLKVVEKAATKAKQGVNPFNGQPMLIKAKPARKAIKAVPLKALKDLV
jgi:nucleoid DNA-binding protein